MINNKEILLGRGVDKLLFGQTRSEVKKILGEPEDIESYSISEEVTSDTFFYDTAGISLTFESDEDYRLTEISIEDDEFHYKNKLKTGLSKDETLNILTEMGLSTPVEDEELAKEFANQELLSLEEENLNLWFEEKVLRAIHFGPFWTEGNELNWPKQ